MVEDGRCTKVTSIDQVTQDQVKRSHVLTLGDLEHPTSRDEPINPRMIGTSSNRNREVDELSRKMTLVV